MGCFDCLQSFAAPGHHTTSNLCSNDGMANDSSLAKMSACALSSTLALCTLVVGGPATAAMINVVGVEFDPANGTTQASISSGGYATDFGLGLFSGGSDDWVPGSIMPVPSTIGTSLGTYFQVPSFQAEYDPMAPRLGNPGSSVTLGTDLPTLTNPRDTIITSWASGFGIRNSAGADLAIFEKDTSEAYAIRVRNAQTGSWTPWYYEIFNQTAAIQFTTATVYELTDLGVGSGEIIDAVEIINLTPDDIVSQSTGEFDGGIELGFGVVTFDGGDGIKPARRRSAPDMELRRFEDGKYDPDIQFVVGLRNVSAIPIPPALVLMLPALGVLVARRRSHNA